MNSRYSASLFKPTTQLAITIVGFASLSLAFQMFSGMPTQGDDLCEGWNPERCTQGYILNGSDPALTYQFNRIVQSLKGASDGTIKQLAECVTFNKVGNALMLALGQSDNHSMITGCSASAEWQNAQSTSGYYENSRANISGAACDAYKLAFAAVVAACQDGGKAFGYDLLIGACIVGGVVGLALCIYGSCKVKSCLEHYSCSCGEKKEKEEAAAAPAGP